MLKMEKIKNGRNNIILVNNKYIIKNAKNEILKAEKIFIENYKDSLMEKIIKEDIKNGYIIYKYIEGNGINCLEDVKNCLNEILNITKKYKKIETNGYGDILNLKSTWQDFLKQEFYIKSKDIKYDSIGMREIVLKKIEEIGKVNIDKKLIHGDLGSFNIICKNQKIVGIIDPRTIVGDPLYDFIYFIFSNHNITNNIDLKDIFEILHEYDVKKIISYLYILLYNRISIEQRNNTNAQNDFIQMWIKIKNTEEEIK